MSPGSRMSAAMEHRNYFDAIGEYAIVNDIGEASQLRSPHTTKNDREEFGAGRD